MHKRAKILLLFVALALFSLFLATSALAAPNAPVKVVNHKTKQCALIFTGDECQSCVSTGDWEILNGACPEEYTQLNTFVQSSCTLTGRGNPICCDIDPSSCRNPVVAAPITKYILIGLLVIGLLAGFVIMFKKRRAVRD